MKPSFSIALTLILLLQSCSQQVATPLDKQVDIGTHQLHIYCIGNGGPTVVIDVGFGESYTSWQAIQEKIARNTRVCAYDRAGYGQSEIGPMPRHSKQVAGELKKLLETAGIEPPYLLVGHSLGGLNMQVFANQYPDLVAGLVLLDPPPLRWLMGNEFLELNEMAQQETHALLAAAEAARQSTDPGENAKAGFYQTLASEHEQMFLSAEMISTIQSFGNMPLFVLASGKPNPAFGESAQAYQQFWIEQSRELARKSTRGTFILAEKSGHQLHVDVPDIVIDTIQQALKQIID